MAGSTMTALLLTAMGAAGTALGGLMVVAQPKMDFKRLGVLQVANDQPCVVLIGWASDRVS